MQTFIDALRIRTVFSKSSCLCSSKFPIVILLAAASLPGIGQSPAPQPQTPPAQPAATEPAQPAQQPVSADTHSPGANAPTDTPGVARPATQSGSHEDVNKNLTLTAGAFSIQTTGGEIKEDQAKQMLAGKTLYIRAGYQDNNLEFDEQGRLTGHSPQGSFTLSQIQVNKVKLSKHKLELECDRYALHFLGAAPYEDPTKATDRVKITPKKKTVRISFDRERVEPSKKKSEKHKKSKKGSDPQSAKSTQEQQTATDDQSAASQEAKAQSSPALSEGDHRPDRDQEAVTTSQVHATQSLLNAIDKVFSQGVDDRMIAAMPDFWKLYYQAAQAKAEIKPVAGSGVFSESGVDQRAKLISVLDPPSNELAQANGVAGIAMYHAIIGSDGKVDTVVAGRPIGFGLDESAEQTIRKATFQPAIKDGKPVPVALDLVVSFRIYSKRTSAPESEESEATQDKSNQPALPGPYTVQAEEGTRGVQQNQTGKSQQTPSTPQ